MSREILRQLALLGYKDAETVAIVYRSGMMGSAHNQQIVLLTSTARWVLAQTSKKLGQNASIEMSAAAKPLVSSIIQGLFLGFALNT